MMEDEGANRSDRRDCQWIDDSILPALEGEVSLREERHNKQFDLFTMIRV